jgi:hypothetical protein
MKRNSRIAFLSSFLTTALLGSGGAAIAADPPDVVYDFPAGVACDFALHVEAQGGNLVYREFTDKNGNVVRTLVAGKGPGLTFTNAQTSATLALKGNGSVTRVSINPDGSSNWIATGHTVVSLFPTDVPAGPSTDLYVGRLEFTVSTTGVYTVQRFNGSATDICAALSS